MSERLLDANQVAERLGCTRRHLENMRRHDPAGAPPSLRLGKLLRFPESRLDAWIEERTDAARPVDRAA